MVFFWTWKVGDCHCDKKVIEKVVTKMVTVDHKRTIDHIKTVDHTKTMHVVEMKTEMKDCKLTARTGPVYSRPIFESSRTVLALSVSYRELRLNV